GVNVRVGGGGNRTGLLLPLRAGADYALRLRIGRLGRGHVSRRGDLLARRQRPVGLDDHGADLARGDQRDVLVGVPGSGLLGRRIDAVLRLGERSRHIVAGILVGRKIDDAILRRGRVDVDRLLLVDDELLLFGRRRLYALGDRFVD